MLIFGVPIEVRTVHRTLWEWTAHLASSIFGAKPRAKVSFVYFSYIKDYEILTFSLRTLLTFVDESLLDRIYIYIDARHPFDDDQRKSLAAISDKVTLRSVDGFSWASPETTFAEVKAFREVAAETAEDNFVAKVDSDILFLSQDKIRMILSSAADFHGDGHFSYYGYAQGGLYFIRASAIRHVLQDLGLERIAEVSQEIDNNGEDRVISALFEMADTPISYTRLMLFPNEYSQLNSLNRFVRRDYCAMHFVKDKEYMLRVGPMLLDTDAHQLPTREAS